MGHQKEMPAEGSKWRNVLFGSVGTVEYNDSGSQWRFTYEGGILSVWCEGVPGPDWELVAEASPSPTAPGVGSVDDIAGRIEAALVGLRESAGRAEAAFHDAEVAFRTAAAEVARFEAALRALRGEEGSAPEAPISAETRDPRQNPETGDTWLDYEGDVVWIVDSAVYRYATLYGRRNDDPIDNPLSHAEEHQQFVRYLGKMSFSEARGRSEYWQS